MQKTSFCAWTLFLLSTYLEIIWKKSQYTPHSHVYYIIFLKKVYALYNFHEAWDLSNSLLPARVKHVSIVVKYCNPIQSIIVCKSQMQYMLCWLFPQKSYGSSLKKSKYLQFICISKIPCFLIACEGTQRLQC